ncbi:hypothetical protein I312_100808 [Cryptococcus bacillisporus CA1280]|uniref:Uncharacterized protein n=1 Tax=Cryptococcus bacillisporus CA1280 TaxID=1296109 RepID=A0A0D0TIV2_CRYGA|nr:hypothetical protein I312_04487 [Cryptococcus bacillisporus CA1280]
MTFTAATNTPGPSAINSPTMLPTDISRRPSPWHDIAHSLSTTSLPPTSRCDSTTSLPTPPSSDSSTPPSQGPALSASQAFREWEERLSQPDSDATRHQLVHPKRSPTPKLAAERDKMGFIEYKLKLINPTAERFERLVTQMMWRLKQGKNEAIYELGLADDGTVVGLTRAEMDASLRTLELMASEVGATVIVLKEIVLNGLVSTQPTASIETITALPPSDILSQSKLINEWIARRPDLNDDGQPRRGNGTPESNGKGRRNKRERKKSKEMRSQMDLKQKVEGDSEVVDSIRHCPSSKSSFASLSTDTDSSFQFDVDDPPALDLHQRHSIFSPSPFPRKVIKPASPKSDKKRRKSAVKQEQRRLDLLRGDGTNPMWAEMTNKSPGFPIESPNAFLLHQPARPSSLRLATPTECPDNSFADDLLHVPLDSLSLSFADVRTLSGTSPSKAHHSRPHSHSHSAQLSAPSPIRPLSPVSDHSAATTTKAGTETEIVLPLDDAALAANKILPPPPGEELICVEALVVRKVQHDHDREDEDGEAEEEEEDSWGYGGEEDVWGFGAEDD